ncbi:MAG: glutamate-5-semialdehyde dehydrogenase [Lachnospiraceae bacterium]|jgi:glutamate-5-semialdehyde dehydrogenase|nr:glutamate-5-semialdehyde dehydrogenase [Lachnospiraceae bacterium]
MEYLEQIGRRAKGAETVLRTLDGGRKDQALLTAAEYLRAESALVLQANEEDMAQARKKGMAPGLLDRLSLTQERIEAMAEGLTQVAAAGDPVGEVTEMKKRPNGLLIGKKRVPLGVVGIIYESRPNVTADAFGLCFKAGNAVILKGGSDALSSNRAIVAAIGRALSDCGLPKEAVQLIDSPDRLVTAGFMKMNGYVDVLIPRGGAGLIRTVVQESTVPVIETGTGNCHIYVDDPADLSMAAKILYNAKTQRTGVCNACESLVVHEAVAGRFLPMAAACLAEKKVELRGDARAMAAEKSIVPATEEDWGKEYLDYILSVKVVKDIGEAIAHINRYNTGHSETIVTKDYAHAQRFLDEIDAAAVYVNASTRFTDGGEFGFGAEIGISTQKLHARGPMGLKELTTTKYIIYGEGQVRE